MTGPNKDWRRAYFRLLAIYLNDKIGTTLDICDSSPPGGAGTLEDDLVDDPIIITTELTNQKANVTTILGSIEDIKDSLEATLVDWSVSRNNITFEFRGMEEP